MFLIKLSRVKIWKVRTNLFYFRGGLVLVDNPSTRTRGNNEGGKFFKLLEKRSALANLHKATCSFYKKRFTLSHPLEWLASNFFLQCNCWITQLSRKNLLIVWHILVRTTRDVWRTVCRIQTDVREKRVTFILESIQIVARMLDRKINFWSFSYGLERK